MRASIKDLFGRARKNLTSLDDQPLGKAALVIILFLDLFILTSIFNGLDQHTRQLASPDEYIPSACRQIVIDLRWNDANRMENLAGIVVKHSTSYYRIEERKKNLHPVCAPYVSLIEEMKNDRELTGAFETRNKHLQEARELRREINAVKGAYDTSLLETIAGQDKGQASVDALKKQIRDRSSTLDRLTRQISAIEAAISRNERIQKLWQLVAGIQEADRAALKDDLRTLNFWFPLKRLGMQLLFLLPLFAAFYVWNGATIRHDRGVQTLVSSHLLVVSFIPILFKIIEAVYDIIPKKLLKRLIALLESLKLVAIWYYLVIALAIAAALVLIYVFQKKLFSRGKMLERRIARGLCQQCGRQMPAGSPACPFCGFAQFTDCKKCGKPTFVYGNHCRECGSPMERQSAGRGPQA